MKVLCLLILIALMINGCAPREEIPLQTPISGVHLYSGYFYNGVTRMYDEDAGVVCWVVEAYRGAGISCLPVSETTLED